jgi:hypothetical protein
MAGDGGEIGPDGYTLLAAASGTVGAAWWP